MIKAGSKKPNFKFLWVVTGNVDYDGSDIIAVCSTSKIADTAIQSDKALRETLKKILV